MTLRPPYALDDDTINGTTGALLSDGDADGANDGRNDGAGEGTDDGEPDGPYDGAGEGTNDGNTDGASDSETDGAVDGGEDGATTDDGELEGTADTLFSADVVGNRPCHHMPETGTVTDVRGAQ